jgi:membrane protein DedA with SNARE-associated domain
MAMFDSFLSILTALWQQDFAILQNPSSAAMIYFCLILFIWLESAFIPAAPLPCDSVVILAGSLAAANVISYPVIVTGLIMAAAIGSQLAFIQGRWLHKFPMIQTWINAVPKNRLQTVDNLLSKHGLLALFVARFIPVVRPLLPLMMGLRMKQVRRFHYFAWISAIIWILLLTGFGYSLSFLPERISKIVTMVLMAAPVITLALAIGSFLSSYFIKKYRKRLY